MSTSRSRRSEEILGALLDISRLDAGATRPEVADVPVADLFRMLKIEFAPIARSKGLELRRRRSRSEPTAA
jgi:signal transduction histidine kinase